MEYACVKCGREFGCEMEISYCPFCGAAYQQAADETNPISTVRIAVGSDSERLVQEKYWRKARASLRETLSLLEASLPDEAEACADQLNLDAWLNRQRKCRSSAQFKRQFASFLQRIHRALQDFALQEAPEPIELPPLTAHIEKTCTLLLRILGEGFLPKPAPQMVYEPISPKEPEPKADATIVEPYRKLLSTIETTRPVFESILDENGVFVALSMLERMLDNEESEEAEPLSLAQQLSELAQKDYDPLFGEEYDDFVLTFWKSILCAAAAANRILVLPERDENEQNKIQALQEYLSQWEAALDIALDQLYESQTRSMVDVSRELEEIEKNYSSSPYT